MYRVNILIALALAFLWHADLHAETRLMRDIQNTLADHPEIDHRAVVVDDFRWGEIRLRGHVPSEREVQLAEAAVRDLPGVRSVDNELSTVRAMLRPVEPEEPVFDDRTAEEQLHGALKEGISATVRDGVAHLEGDVRIHGEADRALAVALNIPGINEVESRITIQGEPYMEVWRKTNPESQEASKELRQEAES